MTERGGTRLSSTESFKGRIFTVTVDRVTVPNGRTVTLDMVRHRGSVVLLPMQDEGRIVLIRQYRYALDRWIWELPAGSLDAGEDPAAAAARECEEEIGLIPGRVEFAGAWYPTPGFCTEVMNYYRLADLRAPAARRPAGAQGRGRGHPRPRLHARRGPRDGPARRHRRSQDRVGAHARLNPELAAMGCVRSGSRRLKPAGSIPAHHRRNRAPGLGVVRVRKASPGALLPIG